MIFGVFQETAWSSHFSKVKISEQRVKDLLANYYAKGTVFFLASIAKKYMPKKFLDLWCKVKGLLFEHVYVIVFAVYHPPMAIQTAIVQGSETADLPELRAAEGSQQLVGTGVLPPVAKTMIRGKKVFKKLGVRVVGTESLTAQ